MAIGRCCICQTWQSSWQIKSSSSASSGDLSRIKHTATWANGRPAVTINVETPDGRLIPHGISVLRIEAGRIVGIDAFLKPELLTRF